MTTLDSGVQSTDDTDDADRDKEDTDAEKEQNTEAPSCMISMSSDRFRLPGKEGAYSLHGRNRN